MTSDATMSIASPSMSPKIRVPPKWTVALAIGVAMVLFGITILGMFPSAPEEPTIGQVPSVFIGLGGLIAILSIVSLRPKGNKARK